MRRVLAAGERIPLLPGRKRLGARRGCARPKGDTTAHSWLPCYRDQDCSALIFAHRAKTALRPCSLNCSGVSFAARARPPFRPPFRPNATAWGAFRRLVFAGVFSGFPMLLLYVTA